MFSRVQLFANPWTAARQASLSITVSWSLLKLMSIESTMPPNHLILCCPFSSRLQSFPASGSLLFSSLPLSETYSLKSFSNPWVFIFLSCQSVFSADCFETNYREQRLVRVSQCSSSSWTKQDFPGGLMVSTSPSNARGVKSIPARGGKVPHALWPKKPKNLRKRNSIVTRSIKTSKMVPIQIKNKWLKEKLKELSKESYTTTMLIFQKVFFFFLRTEDTASEHQ